MISTLIRPALAAVLLLPVAAQAEYEARAVIKAIDRAMLSSELAAQVTSIPVRPGEAFAKGAPLVKLNCDLYQAQAEKVSAQVQATRIKRDNAQELKALNSIGAMDVALAQSEYAQSLAELKIARLNTERCTIKAPWAGRVVTVHINAHEIIRQQQELIEIVGFSVLEADIVVPAAWLSWLKPGQPIELRVDDRSEPTAAVLSAIIPAIDAVSQTVLLRAKITQESELIPGMSASAVFTPPSAP